MWDLSAPAPIPPHHDLNLCLLQWEHRLNHRTTRGVPVGIFLEDLQNTARVPGAAVQILSS